MKMRRGPITGYHCLNRVRCVPGPAVVYMNFVVVISGGHPMIERISKDAEGMWTV